MKQLKNVVKNWENLTDDERQELINEHTVGCIENGNTVFIELLKFKETDLHSNYEWDNEELIYQIEDYKPGITKLTLMQILELNK
jgi:hypothetical protein